MDDRTAQLAAADGKPCVGADPEVFFPAPSDVAGAERAKRYCRRCPAVRLCLAVALEQGQQGVWGGTTSAERDDLRRTYGLPEPEYRSPLPETRQDLVQALAQGGVSVEEITARTGTTERDVARDLRRIRTNEPPPRPRTPPRRRTTG